MLPKKQFCDTFISLFLQFSKVRIEPVGLIICQRISYKMFHYFRNSWNKKRWIDNETVTGCATNHKQTTVLIEDELAYRW